MNLLSLFVFLFLSVTIFEGISRLDDLSLVRVVKITAGTETDLRFEMLETIRFMKKV